MKHLKTRPNLFSYPSNPRLRPLMVLTAGLFMVGLGGCGDDEPVGADYSPITCGTNLTCTVLPGPLPSSYRGNETWNPCNGGSFSFTGEVDFADVNDFVYIGSEKFGSQGFISGNAPKDVAIMIMTNDTIDSVGVKSLTAVCDGGNNQGTGQGTGNNLGSSTMGPAGTSTSSSSTSSAGGNTSQAPDMPRITCSGFECYSYPNPLPNNVNISAIWNPCGGKGFDYTGTIDLEENKDFFAVATSLFTGTKSIMGSTQGPVTLRVTTDAATQSVGLTKITATCKAESGNTAGGTGTGSTNGPDDSSNGDDTGKDKTENLDCSGLTCKTIVNPIPHNLKAADETVTWDPCEGKAFSYTGKINFEGGNNTDWIAIGGTSYTGLNDAIAGEATGAVEVKLQTNATVNSTSAEFTATCKDGTDTAGTTTGADTAGTTTGSTGDTGTTDNTGNDSSGSTDSTGNSDEYLVCSSTGCSTPNSPIPDGQEVTVNWDPCNGEGFEYAGAINLQANDRLSFGTGDNRENFSGQTTVNGQVESSELPVQVRLWINSLEDSIGITEEIKAICPNGSSVPFRSVNEYFDCSGDSCTSRVDKLPWGIQLDDSTIQWNPCQNRGQWFRYSGNVAFIGSDMMCIDGRRARVSAGDNSSLPTTGWAKQPALISVLTFSGHGLDDNGEELRSLGLEGSLTSDCTITEAPTIANWLDTEVDEYITDLQDAFFAVESPWGEAAFKAYRDWYNTNLVTGGEKTTNFPGGSGYAFLGMNRALLRHYSNFLREVFSADVIPLRIRLDSPFPARFTDTNLGNIYTAQDALNLLNQRDDINHTYEPATGTTLQAIGNEDAIGLTRWLSASESDRDLISPRWRATISFDGQTFGALSDFDTPDQLGRSMLLLANDSESYVGAVHSRIGGTFDSAGAVADPMFYLWCRHIDEIFESWLRTEKGRAWEAENPNHVLLSWGGLNTLEGWNFSDFPN